MNGRGYISLSDALAGRFDGLERAHEFAFSDRSLKKSFRLEVSISSMVTFRPLANLDLKWPVPSTGHGYSSYARQITVRDSTKSVNPITVARLARKVAEEVKRFIELNENVVIDDPLWRVGPGYITLDRLLLVEVRQVSEESIQPVLRLTVDRG
ncbi:hypothetical protein B0H21DRAFT_700595 [Amylocystis lapponica]|nr:hypothetical protein B0H21DRAFT_700595 [Amylocystis lapponica]